MCEANHFRARGGQWCGQADSRASQRSGPDAPSSFGTLAQYGSGCAVRGSLRKARCAMAFAARKVVRGRKRAREDDSEDEEDTVGKVRAGRVAKLQRQELSRSQSDAM